jgi:hypothetical protein
VIVGVAHDAFARAAHEMRVVDRSCGIVSLGVAVGDRVELVAAGPPG